MIHDDLIRQEIKYEHNEIVAKISGLLAKKANYSLEEAKMIESAALLHDIGKQYVPFEILSKPAALTEQEFNIIKTHADKGYEYLIQTIRSLLIAAIISLQHHERPDGNGYSKIINIHPYAKLVAVADVFDALISKRCYKESWSAKDACDYIKENAHKQFEADYVTLLLDSLDEILMLYREPQAAL